MNSRLATLRTRLKRQIDSARLAWLRRVWGMTIGSDVRISRKALLDYTNPKGVHIGDHTTMTPLVQMFTHDFVNARHVDTYIGSCCFLGAGAIVLPGVRIGDHCVVAAGSVVNRDVPSHSLVAGNPAKVIRSGIVTGHHGIMAPTGPGYPHQQEEAAHA